MHPDVCVCVWFSLVWWRVCVCVCVRVICTPKGNPCHHPKFSYNPFFTFTAEEGGVYVFYGGKSFPSGKATRGCKEVEPCPEEKVKYTHTHACLHLTPPDRQRDRERERERKKNRQAGSRWMETVDQCISLKCLQCCLNQS